MSFTLTSTSKLEKTEAYHPPTVYLSPTKRRRLSSPHPEVGSSIQDIYNWTFHSDAIAKCAIDDVLHMKPSAAQSSSYPALIEQLLKANCLKSTEYDFYWLGSVPCRSVKIVGMVVGIQIYEKRILYSGEYSMLGIFKHS